MIEHLVGAPLVGALVEGTHKGCPYEPGWLPFCRAALLTQALRQIEPSAILPLDLPCSPAYSSQVEKGKQKEQVANSSAA
jgi:hypothetical protein